MNTARDKFDAYVAEAIDRKAEPSEIVQRVREIINPEVKDGGEFDPCDEGRKVAAHDLYAGVARSLAESGFQYAAEQLLVGFWEELSDFQLHKDKYVDHPWVAFHLALIHEKIQQDHGSAIRWTLLAHIADLLGKHDKGGGSAKEFLQTVFGLTDAELSAIADAAISAINAFEQKLDDVSRPKLFPEDVLTCLTLGSYSFGNLFSLPSKATYYPICKAYVQTLLKAIEGDHPNPTSKGKSLEQLATYLFLTLPACIVSRNVVDEDNACESDLIITNLHPGDIPSAALLGRHVLAESKNWENSVGVSHVGYFLHRVRMMHCTLGVIFAKSGITGKDEKEARALIRRAFHEDSITCIVIDRNHIEEIVEGKITFWHLILRELHSFRFGKPKA